MAKQERDSLLLLKVDDALSSGGLLFKGGSSPIRVTLKMGVLLSEVF